MFVARARGATREVTMRKYLAGAAVVALSVAGLSFVSTGAGARASQTAGTQQFVVVYAAGAPAAAPRAAIADAGGTIVAENRTVGVATVTTRNGAFAAEVVDAAAIEGAAHNRVIGRAPERRGADGKTKFDPAEADLLGASAGGPTPSAGRGEEPLAGLQWDMQQIGATAAGSHRYERGRGVRVGIVDTGVDGSHPDIAPNFDAALSRNFTVDIPTDANGA